MTNFRTEINGHHVVELSRLTSHGPSITVPVCFRCGAHFSSHREIEATTCPAAGPAHGHDLLPDPETGLLHCSRCPMVAYDQADAESEPSCPMPLR